MDLIFWPFHLKSHINNPMYVSLNFSFFFFFFLMSSIPLWHPGPDNAYFFYGHYLRNIADDVENGKNHGGCHTLPPEFAIDLQPEFRL